MSGSLNSRWVVQVSLTIINIIGFLVFLRGFSIQSCTSGVQLISRFNEISISDQYGNPQFNKFILMVVDAMRSDFVSVTDQISCFAPIDKPRSRLTIYCLFQSTNSDITTFKRYHHRRYTKLFRRDFKCR